MPGVQVESNETVKSSDKVTSLYPWPSEAAALSLVSVARLFGR
jgi:hypothetical protein